MKIEGHELKPRTAILLTVGIFFAIVFAVAFAPLPSPSSTQTPTTQEDQPQATYKVVRVPPPHLPLWNYTDNVNIPTIKLPTLPSKEPTKQVAVTKVLGNGTTSIRVYTADEIAHQIHDLVNQYRSNPNTYEIVYNPNGKATDFARSQPLTKLEWSTQLANISLLHSTDMATNNFYDHINKQGQNPTDRATAAGYSCRIEKSTYIINGVAENLDWMKGYSNNEIAKVAVDSWVLSDGHRANLESPDALTEGIGMAFGSDGVYITEDFC